MLSKRETRKETEAKERLTDRNSYIPVAERDLRVSQLCIEKSESQ